MLYRRFIISNQITCYRFNNVLKDTSFSATLSHNLKIKDQGGYHYDSGYKERLYYKNSQEKSNSIGIWLHVKLFTNFRLKPTYNIELIEQKKFSPKEQRGLIRKRYGIYVNGIINKYEIKANIIRIHEKFESNYWKINVKIRRSF